MPLRVAVPALVVLVLALFPAGAQAAAWAIAYQPDVPVAGDEIAFHADRVNPGNASGAALVWDFGDGGTGATADATHCTRPRATTRVVLGGAESGGSTTIEDSVVVHVTPAPPPPPPENNASIRRLHFLADGPARGRGRHVHRRVATRTGTRSRALGLRGPHPGLFGCGTGPFLRPRGDVTVSLSVSDDRGGFASTSQELTVAPQPPSTPPAEQAGAPIADQPGRPAVPDRSRRPSECGRSRSSESPASCSSTARS